MEERYARAMVFQDVGAPFALHRIPRPALREGEALVAVSYATICTSDLHTYNGRRGGPRPSILGHEIMGQIVDLAEGGVQDYYENELHPGDTVTWSVYAYDHGGTMARRGMPQKSADLFKYGHEKLRDDHPLSGGFASHCHLRKGTDIFRLPEDLPRRAAAPINCTHATIAGALRLAGDLAGKRVLIAGAGMLGLSACAQAREAGVARVWTMDVVGERLKRSLAFGADAGFDANRPLREIAARVREHGGVDVLIETSGAPAAMESGIDLLNIGGISVWVGAVYTQRPLQLDAEKVVRNLLTIKGLHNYSPRDLATAVRFIEANHRSYPFEALVAEEFPLADLDRAFSRAAGSGHYRIGVYSR